MDQAGESDARVGCPAIVTVEELDKRFWEEFFKRAEQDDVVFPMEIDPASVTISSVILRIYFPFVSTCVIDLIKGVVINITQTDV
jgi:hypothetical protein